MNTRFLQDWVQSLRGGIAKSEVKLVHVDTTQQSASEKHTPYASAPGLNEESKDGAKTGVHVSETASNVDRMSFSEQPREMLKVLHTQSPPVLPVKSIVSTRAWKASLFRLGPLSGLAGIVLTLGSLAASLGILAGSNGQQVSTWSAPPATYLAIFTAIGNLAIRYAAIQGVIIAWWSRACKGSTLSKLHWDWRSGTTLRGALTAGRHTGLLSLACIFSTLVVIDGPLLQRSSTVISAPRINNFATLSVAMAQELPSGLSGSWISRDLLGDPSLRFSVAFNDTIPTNDGSNPQAIQLNPNPYFIPAFGDWTSRSILKEVISGCPANSTCEIKLMAPTLWPTVCTSHSVALNLHAISNPSAIGMARFASPLDSYGFLVDTSLIIDEREKVNLITGFSTPVSDECHGDLNYSICTLESAIGEYSVSINDEGMNLDTISQPSLVAFANNTAVNHTISATGLFSSTLAGIVAEITSQLDLWVAFYTEPGKDGSPQRGWLTDANARFEPFIEPGTINPERCPSFRDPHEEVMKSINQLMIYVGAFMASKPHLSEGPLVPSIEARMDSGIPMHYSISGEVKGEHPVFTTDYWFFMGAAIMQLLCIALVLPTYWGWWKIGRPVSSINYTTTSAKFFAIFALIPDVQVSFSPLEMAKAFDSPMLQNFNSNSSGRDLANVTNEFHVRYGQLNTSLESGATKIMFSSPGLTKTPLNGTQFD